MRGRHFRAGPGPGCIYFNPRPHAGATIDGLTTVLNSYDFNPRPHAGATPVSMAVLAGLVFQSTPPCGGDRSRGPADRPGRISIHAPMRGRRNRRGQWVFCYDFNPRPHAGATHLGDTFQQSISHFNPRPHAGATSSTRTVMYPGARFQSTPPCGGDGEPTGPSMSGR